LRLLRGSRPLPPAARNLLTKRNIKYGYGKNIALELTMTAIPPLQGDA
jgi:hypothetical protein